MDVFFQELKRQLSFKRLLIYVLIAVILAGMKARFIIGGASEGFMQSGCYKGYKGRDAIAVAARDRKPTVGTMTEDKFQKGQDIFIKSLRSDDESDVVITNDLLQYAVYADVLVTQEVVLRKMRGESTKGILNLPKDAGKCFYENEDLYYREYIDKNSKDQSEKALALSMWDKVKKPYTYYSGFMQWSEGIEHMVRLAFLFMGMIAFFSSSMISKDKENGMDEIIKTTRKGKKNLTIAKIVIPWIMATIIYLCGMGIYVALLKIFLPSDALNTSMQVFAKSIFPYNGWQLLRNLFIFGIIGALTIASFSTWVSSITKKSSVAILCSVLTILVTYEIGKSLSFNSLTMDAIKSFLPGGIVFSHFQVIGLGKLPIMTFFGKSFWIPSLSLIVSGIIFLVTALFTGLNYRRR